MVAQNLHDALVVGVSAQGRYEFAYNAARLMATVVVRACGYRVTSKKGHHYYTFIALETADQAFAKEAAVFDVSRSKRNDFSYDAVVNLSETDVADLIATVERFRDDAEKWIAARFPALA